MRKKVAIAVASAIVVLTGGGIMAINQPDNSGQTVKSTVTQPAENKEETPVVQPEQTEQPVQQQVSSTVSEPQETPKPNQCALDKAAAIAPLQAKIDETKRLAKEMKDGWNAGRGTNYSEAELDSMIQMKFGRVFAANQAAYDQEAAKFNC